MFLSQQEIKFKRNSPDVHSLREEEGVVQVSDGAVHGIAVSHFHHCCSWLTLHELDLWGMTEVKTEN